MRSSIRKFPIMIWLTIPEMLCLRGPLTCTSCHSHNPLFLSLFLHDLLPGFSVTNAMGATSGAGTSYLLGESEFTQDFKCGNRQ